jgi:flagellar basal body P-ring formation protein FlgA
MNTTAISCNSRARGWPALCGVLLTLLMASVFGADDSTDLQGIRAAAESAVRDKVGELPGRTEIAAEALDARLNMPGCDAPLSAAVPNYTKESSRVVAEVRCDGSQSWRLFVPVRVSAFRMVVVAAVPLERGKVLAADDVILAEREVSASTGGYLAQSEAAVGRTLRRPVAPGAILTPSALTSAVLVRRGQPVTLEARANGFTVQMAGIAKGDGALGQTIPVENTSSRKVLQGVVRNEKSVQVLLP